MHEAGREKEAGEERQKDPEARPVFGLSVFGAPGIAAEPGIFLDMAPVDSSECGACLYPDPLFTVDSEWDSGRRGAGMPRCGCRDGRLPVPERLPAPDAGGSVRNSGRAYLQTDQPAFGGGCDANAVLGGGAAKDKGLY